MASPFQPNILRVIQRCAAETPRLPDVDVEALRSRMNLNQKSFAALLGLPVDTVRNWEYKRRNPEVSARIMLAVLERNPVLVMAAIYPDVFKL